MKRSLAAAAFAAVLVMPAWADEDDFEVLEHDVIKLALGKAKVGMKQAIEAAAKEAGNAQLAEAELSLDGDTPVFEIGFLTDGGAWEITVDAVTGKVLKKEEEKPDSEEADEYKQTSKALSAAKFTLLQAIDAAMSEVKGGTVVEAEAEVENGRFGFEVQVLSGDHFTRFHIDGNGRVLRTEVETPEGQAWTFDGDEAGKEPVGWRFGYTKPADGKAAWTIAKDAKAMSGPNVLTLDAKSGGGTFNLAMAKKATYQDVDVRARIRANTGKADQGGGLIWRLRDEQNYYVCRINPLENNFRVYKVVGGKREQIQSADCETEAGKWHVVRAKMVGKHIQCFVDGKKLLDVTDDTLEDAGFVGLWSKADASSSFDNVAVKPKKASKSDAGSAKPDGSSSMALVRTIPLGDVEGRIDHLAVDATGTRLWVAALGNDTIEVIDLESGTRLQSIDAAKEPQGVCLIPETNRIVVASGEDGMCRTFDTARNIVASLGSLDDADNVRYDPREKRLYVGYGKGTLAVVDCEKGVKLADIRLAGHPESFQLERQGRRIFVNVPTAGHVAVVDRDQAAVVAIWPISDAGANYPMALDEVSKRLFVVARKPAKLLVLDSESGKNVATLDCCGDADDIFYDAARRQLYVSGGEGCISVFQQEGADRYTLKSTVPTVAGARTSLFVPETSRLFLAVPRSIDHAAEVREYRIQP